MHDAFRRPHHMAAKHLYCTHSFLDKAVAGPTALLNVHTVTGVPTRLSRAHLADALMPHAHPKQRNVRSQLLHDFQRDP